MVRLPRHNRGERGHERTLWFAWIAFTALFITIGTGVFMAERGQRLRAAQEHLQTELSYLRHVIAGSLLNGDYELARDQITAWGQLNGDTAHLRLSADNGFILGEFLRDLPGRHITGDAESITYSYRDQATLQLEKSIEPVHASIVEFGVQLFGGLAIGALVALYLIRQLVRYHRQVELTHAEYKRRLDAQNALERMATLDALTDLPNRYMLDMELRQRLAESQRFERSLGVLFIDLDNFKTINDSFGHDAGDQLLKAVAKRVGTCLRAYDLLARFGGDELVVLISNVRTSDEVEHIADKIIHALKPRIEVGGRELFMSCSIGISLFPNDGTNAVELLRKADAAMYTAKEAGRNCSRFYSESMNAALIKRQQIEHNLHDAVANGDLFLVYQPQVDVRTGTVHSCEALLRWNLNGEAIPPAEFLAVAEQSTLMKPVQKFVIEAALRQCSDWRRAGIFDVRVDINLSGNRAVIDDMLSLLDGLLRQFGLAPADIGIELTEHTLIEASDQTIASLRALRTAGCRVSLDDFGTGYSSLGYLKHLPVDILKIDRAFIRDLPNDPQDAAIIKAIVAMGKSLDKQILAEGIETAAQLQYVSEQGCDLAQGYLLCRPLPAAQIEPLLRDGVNRFQAANVSAI